MNGSPGTARLRTPSRPRRSVPEVVTTIAKRGSSAALAVTSAGAARLRGEMMAAAARRRLRSMPRPLRLCLGSGHAPIPGWTNVDFEPPADILLDLRYGLPVDAGSVDLIYSEHLVEHVPLETALHVFQDWRRAISEDGVVRIATPDLERLIVDYRSNDWRSRHEWVNWPEYSYVDSPVHMINVAMRAWGHEYLYDFDELSLRLRASGFSDVRREGLGESSVEALRGLETRADSTLVVEARP